MPDSGFFSNWRRYREGLFPVLGEAIRCPCCDRSIPALVLTNAYLCSRHDLFEVDPVKNGIIWAEIFAALDQLHHQGFYATGITLVQRYRDLVIPYVESRSDWFRQIYYSKLRLFGLPVTFQPDTQMDSRWQVITFELAKNLGSPKTYSYLACTRMNEGLGK